MPNTGTLGCTKYYCTIDNGFDVRSRKRNAIQNKKHRQTIKIKTNVKQCLFRFVDVSMQCANTLHMPNDETKTTERSICCDIKNKT